MDNSTFVVLTALYFAVGILFLESLTMSTQSERIRADIAAQKTVIASAVAGWQGVIAAIRELQAKETVDPAELGALADDLEANTKTLADALTENVQPALSGAPVPTPLADVAPPAVPDANLNTVAPGVDSEAAPTAVVINSDAVTGEGLPQPVIVTDGPDGPLLTPVVTVGGNGDLGVINVSADGVPVASDLSTVLGTPEPAPDDHPSVADIVADPTIETTIVASEPLADAPVE